jgi:hypothetical protein
MLAAAAMLMRSPRASVLYRPAAYEGWRRTKRRSKDPIIVSIFLQQTL